MARKFEPTDLQSRILGFCREYAKKTQGREPGVAEVALACECTMHEAASALRLLRHFGLLKPTKPKAAAGRRQGGA